MMANADQGMCSELKVNNCLAGIRSRKTDPFNQHLYVAITRARIQLFLFESDETAVASVIKLLTQDVPQPLVEITRPNDANVSNQIIEIYHFDLA